MIIINMISSSSSSSSKGTHAKVYGYKVASGSGAARNKTPALEAPEAYEKLWMQCCVSCLLLVCCCLLVLLKQTLNNQYGCNVCICMHTSAARRETQNPREHQGVIRQGVA